MRMYIRPIIIMVVPKYLILESIDYKIIDQTLTYVLDKIIRIYSTPNSVFTQFYSMSKVIEVHRKVHNNVGDYFCNPSRYFTIDADSQELMYNPTPLDDKDLIVGGGGLIHKKFNKHIQILLHKNPRTATLWGIGHNFGAKHVTKVGDVYYPDWIERCNLIGIRDWIDGYHKWYLPCVSCMHPCFSWNYEVRHETVYSHIYPKQNTKATECLL